MRTNILMKLNVRQRGRREGRLDIGKLVDRWLGRLRGKKRRMEGERKGRQEGDIKGKQNKKK